MVVTVSARSKEADGRKNRERGKNACQRIRSLPILTDIVEWIKEGHPAAEVARRIHANGFLDEVPFELLRQEVVRYVKDVMDPTSALSATQMSSLQQHAAQAMETAVAELTELGDLYRMQKSIFCEVTGMQPGPGTIGADTEPPVQVELPEPKEGGLEGATKAPKAVATGLRPKDFKQVRELIAEMRQTIRVHGSLRERLGGLGGPEERQATMEERLAGVVKGRFPGRMDVQEALLDPRRRAKVLGLLHRFLTSDRSQDAAAAALAGEIIQTPEE